MKAKAYAMLIDGTRRRRCQRPRMQPGRSRPTTRSGITVLEVFEQQSRSLAFGEEIVFRAPSKEKGIGNGDRATVLLSARQCEGANGRQEPYRDLVQPAKPQHFDYGDASTNYGAQGATVDRVRVHMNTVEKGAKAMLNSAMAYVYHQLGLA